MKPAIDLFPLRSYLSFINYEMLGRYTDAKERAEKLVTERQRAIYEIKSSINGDHAPEDVKKIDWQKTRSLLDAAESLDSQLRTAWDEANSAAEIIGKPKLGYKR